MHFVLAKWKKLRKSEKVIFTSMMRSLWSGARLFRPLYRIRTPLSYHHRERRHCCNHRFFVTHKMPSRRLPNILITGTPGTGKSTLTELLQNELSGSGFQFVNIGEIVRAKQLYVERDEHFDTYIVDEERVEEEMEELMTSEQGGVIVDHHSCDIFPTEWLDLVVVLQCDNTTLYDRLQARGYTDHKIRENVECEIMMVVLEEAHEVHDSNKIMALESRSLEQMEANRDRVLDFIRKYSA